MASGCSGVSAANQARRQLQQGCGCVSCPCPSGGGKTPYECKSYNSSAVTAAIAGSDLVILAVGLGANVESEGRDREKNGLNLPGKQNDLVKDAIVAAKSKGVPVIALLFVAGPVDPALFDGADAVIDCLYPAEMTGLAITDALFAGSNGSSLFGRLPFSWPTTAMDVLPEADYTMVGRTYRYAQQNVKWAFGSGKTYSEFEYLLRSVHMSSKSFKATACFGVYL